MDFQTMETKLREAAKKNKPLCGVRKAWLTDAANMAEYCGAIEFETEFVALDELNPKSKLWYSNDCIENDDTKKADDFLVFDEVPMAAFSADGTEVVASVDPVES